MIPAWTMSGILPPIRPGELGHGADRSPYPAPLCEVIEQFASSPKRIAILQGFLNYRAALHKLGLVSGFQWLDGSFMENVETQELRSPNDMDVVTYFHLPVGETQITLLTKAGNLLSNNHVKATYSVDAYPHILGEPTSAVQIRQISYWYSMWSHRRDGTWKGFVQVDLDPQEDVDAGQVLSVMRAGGTTP
ncbi:DUF6932 family protein [Collimonas antrihumi]|uniref:DUF6932 family protein n=1 Tax=Collimonas antrihumi TaxID=1940615 RepID=UPI001B8C0D1C|nr:hypothetical protein [Collimonas antrihumi]